MWSWAGPTAQTRDKRDLQSDWEVRHHPHFLLPGRHQGSLVSILPPSRQGPGIHVSKGLGLRVRGSCCLCPSASGPDAASFSLTFSLFCFVLFFARTQTPSPQNAPPADRTSDLGSR